ncbi:MAG: ribonuclease H [Acidobacteriota bacterium]
MSSTNFTCRECGSSFTVKPEILARYPGWQPAICWPCKQKQGKSTGGGGSARKPRKSSNRGRARKSKGAGEQNLPTAKVLEKYTGGPQDGIFTDGACSGNPGPGGWGMVHVENGEILAQKHGHDPDTTNNRMELTALLAAYESLPRDAEVTIWTDSKLCVQTINQWAAGWQKRGWTRKTGPVQNLDLVKPLYEMSLRHPKVTLRWIKAHDGSLWNEYADALATAYLRGEV